jgi:hypothetical protein
MSTTHILAAAALSGFLSGAQAAQSLSQPVTDSLGHAVQTLADDKGGHA